MLIINADDFGRNVLATDRILSCYEKEAVTSTSAMVFMGDSERAADLAGDLSIDVGLHVNFTEKLTQSKTAPLFDDYHQRVAGFLKRRKYNFMIYNPALRNQFKYLFQAQLEEFQRLYHASPSHIDGHHHMHLCANMLVETIVPEAQKVRRNYTFVSGEKSIANRMYRSLIDKWLSRRYVISDYLFSLSDCVKTGRLIRAIGLARSYSVELQTHPELVEEFRYLMGDEFVRTVSGLQIGTYAELSSSSNV